MSFHGIDPDGLTELAGIVVATGDHARQSSRAALAVLHRNDRTAAATELASAVSRIGMWTSDLADTLRWRSNAISDGQHSRLNVSALLRAQFATEAVFTAASREAAYRQWIAERMSQERAIAEVVADITRWLSQGLADWDVSNNDLHNIRLALDDLTTTELDRVLLALTPGQLERWIAEMGHRINGFSRDEKRDVFALLASRASGDSLGRVHDAVLAAAGTDELNDLGEAIRVHSADHVIVEFVGSVARRDLTSQRFWGLAPMLAMTGLDDRSGATAATKIFVAKDAALGSAAVDSLLHDEAGGLLSAWASTLAQTADDGDRTAAFASFATLATNQTGILGELIAERRHDIAGRGRPTSAAQTATAQDALAAVATQLIEGDPSATIKHLASSLDPEGVLTSAYWQLMVENGYATSIGSILRALRGGDDVDIETFSAMGLDPDYRYPQARNLAYAAATLNRGFVGAADAAKGDIDTIVQITGVATTVIGLFAKGADVITSLVGGSADLGVATHRDRVRDDIDAQLADLIDTMGAQLRPTDERLTDPPTGLSGALTAWLNTYTALLDRA